MCQNYDFSKTIFKNMLDGGQDGGIGRYALLPQTTKRRTTTNLKTKNNQNCQKIKLCVSPTIKELKKHSSRLIEGQRGRMARGWTRQAHICVQISREEQLRSETDHLTGNEGAGKK